MFKKMISIVSVAGVVFVLAFGASNASAGVITDDFNTSHDYSGGNVTGTIWDGIRYKEGNVSSVVANANTTTAGQLHLASANGAWSGGDNDGLLLYKNVTGDFVARVEVTSANAISHHDMGLVARVANDGDAGAGEDWVAIRHFARDSKNGYRNTDNGGSTGPYNLTYHSFLELERSGDDFILRHDADGLGAYTDITTITRTDMNGLAVQVGIWQATFSGTVGTATFDNFSLVPEPATMSLLALGGLAVLRRRRK